MRENQSRLWRVIGVIFYAGIAAGHALIWPDWYYAPNLTFAAGGVAFLALSTDPKYDRWEKLWVGGAGVLELIFAVVMGVIGW